MEYVCVEGITQSVSFKPVRAIFPQSVQIIGQKGVLVLILGVLRKF